MTQPLAPYRAYVGSRRNGEPVFEDGTFICRNCREPATRAGFCMQKRGDGNILAPTLYAMDLHVVYMCDRHYDDELLALCDREGISSNFGWTVDELRGLHVLDERATAPALEEPGQSDHHRKERPDHH